MVLFPAHSEFHNRCYSDVTTVDMTQTVVIIQTNNITDTWSSEVSNYISTYLSIILTIGPSWQP